MAKVEREDKVFIPVKITLETQEELDQFYGVANCARLCDEVPVLCEIHGGLYAYGPDEGNRWSNVVNGLME